MKWESGCHTTLLLFIVILLKNVLFASDYISVIFLVGLKALEHLFFFKLIGDAPIDTFLLEMLETPIQ